MAKQILTVIILSALLLGALGYIGFMKYSEMQAEEQNTLVGKAIQVGYEEAVSQLYTEAIKCTTVPVTFENKTINMIAVECLQQNQAQQAE